LNHRSDNNVNINTGIKTQSSSHDT